MQSKHIFKAFLFFYKQRYKNRTIDYSEKNQNKCENFIDLLKNEYENIQRLDIDFLWFYFNFQFQYYQNVDICNYKNKITIDMIIGNKAFDRYLNRDTSFDWLVNNKSGKNNRKSFELYVNLPHKNNDTQDDLYDADEYYRQMFFNQSLGLSNCIMYTSLYDEKSKLCVQCQFKQQCVNIQKQVYRNIYNDRKIE